MLTFTHSEGSGLRITGGPKPVSVFVTKASNGDDIRILANPEEEPTPNTISWPGEYDRAGITVRGIGHADGQQVSYMVEIDECRIAFPSSPLAEWSDTEIEQLGDVHVLVLPAEDPKRCQKLLDEIDPRMLLLVPAADGSLHPDVIKACGAAGKEQVSEYKMKGSMQAEGREVVVFGS